MAALLENTAALAAVSAGVLGELVGNVRIFRADIITALDFLFTGICVRYVSLRNFCKRINGRDEIRE